MTDQARAFATHIHTDCMKIKNKTSSRAGYIGMVQLELPRPIPRNSVKSDLGRTSRTRVIT